MKNKVVYVVTQQKSSLNPVNERVGGIASLKDEFAKLYIVKQGDFNEDVNGFYMVKAYMNPSGLLRYLKLFGLKNKLDSLLYFPTPTILYVRAVIRKLRQSIEADIKNQLDISLVTSVPPHDLCMIGLELKKEFPQIRWIMDWQDLWSYDEVYLEKTRPKARQRLVQVEEDAVRSCDMNVTTNKRARNVLVEKYDIGFDKVRSIYHHYSEKQKDALDCPYTDFSKQHKGPIKIGFLGNMFKMPKVPGDRVVSMVKNMRSKGRDVELHIYGDMSNAATEYADQGIIFHDRTTHFESLKNISECDFLLLLLENLPNSKVILHQKLPHYLLLNKPIIAIVPDESAVADAIEETGAGFVVPVVDDWEQGITKITDDFRNGRLTVERKEDGIAQYSWSETRKSWLEVL